MDDQGGKVVYVEGPEGMISYTLRQDDFTIDPSFIDKELCQMGRTMLQYGEIETALQLEVERKKSRLEHMKAELDGSIRKEWADAGIKFTEGKISNHITCDPKKRDLEEQLANSRMNHAMARWAMTALQGKLQCLNALAYRERQLMKADHY